MKDAQKEKKPLSKRDKVLLIIAGIGLAIALCCQGWYFWPWIGGNVIRGSAYNWEKCDELLVPIADAPSITNYSPYTKRQVIKYYHDIVLRREDQTNVHTCQKWAEPIRLFIGGEPDEADLATLREACAFLNSIPGFPGISEVSAKEEANITMLFTEEIMKGMNGTFNIRSTDDKGNTTDVLIRIRNSLPREKKNSVIWEELLQSTGPMNDTLLTDDTLFYNGKTDIPRASELDRTLLEMLYHPEIKSGMDYIQSLAVFWTHMK